LKSDGNFKLQRRQIGYISSIVKSNNVIADAKHDPVQRAKPCTAAYAPATFGKANRPSTPIQGVISNTYANLAEKELHDKYDQVYQEN